MVGLCLVAGGLVIDVRCLPVGGCFGRRLLASSGHKTGSECGSICAATCALLAGRLVVEASHGLHARAPAVAVLAGAALDLVAVQAVVLVVDALPVLVVATLGAAGDVAGRAGATVGATECARGALHADAAQAEAVGAGAVVVAQIAPALGLLRLATAPAAVAVAGAAPQLVAVTYVPARAAAVVLLVALGCISHACHRQQRERQDESARRHVGWGELVQA